MFDGLRQDLRWSWRGLRADRAASAMLVATLALAIGATVTVFSAVDAWLIKPLRFPEADRLVLGLAATRERPSEPAVFLPYRVYRAVEERSRSFEIVSAAFRRSYLVRANPEPATMLGMVVTPGFFRTLGVAAAHGRTLSDRDVGHPAVVLGYGVWERHFGASPAAIGTHVTLNGAPHQIVGVMPRDFDVRMLEHDRPFELWTLFAEGDAAYVPGGIGPVAMFGRLRRGITAGAAQAELAAIHRNVETAYVRNFSAYTVLLTRLQDDNTRTVRATLITVSAAVAGLLLIACLNVGGVQIGRAVTRRRDAAIRAALGAGRGRLIRLAVAEALLLSAAGGALGLLIASGATRVFTAWDPLGTLPPGGIALDFRAFGFTLFVIVVVATACGALPAMRAAGVDPVATLRGGGERGLPASALRYQLLLLAGQIAASVVLVVATTLLVRTFVRLYDEPLGFDAANLTVIGLALPTTEFDTGAKRNLFYHQLADRLSALPGVTRVAASTLPALSGGPTVAVRRSADELEGGTRLTAQDVTVNFFEALGIPLHAGRTFGDADSAASRPVAVLNERAALELFNGARQAVGQRVRVGAEWRDVVGVVGDTRSAFYNTLQWETRARIYLPAAQAFTVTRDPTLGTFMVHVHVRAEAPLSMLDARRAVALVSAGVAVTDVSTAADAIGKAVRQPAFRMTLLGWFAFATALLAALGVYALVAQTVAGRMREIGVRLALGARVNQVLWVVTARAMLAALGGAASGSIAALALGRQMRALLYGVAANDALSFLAAAAALLAVAATAAAVPALRAARIDPSEVLRRE
jgi:putative ABC transport system permease protein